jgi:DNA modification methylase
MVTNGNISFEEMKDKIFCEDCLIGMKRIPDGSVDAIICDLPYGYIESKWDVQIPLDILWVEYKRILKPQGVVALFGNEPFASLLRTSNLEWYKYDWYWHKTTFANFAQAPYMPLKNIETISVFSKGNIAPNSKIKTTYFPQGVKECFKQIVDKPCAKAYRPNRKPQTFTQTQTDYPRQLLKFNKDPDSWHPTQKPVDLLRYLVLTYTNEGDTVLDNCMGSGTTAVAALMEKRHFIGFELNKEYYDKACKRIALEQLQPTLF